MRDSLVNRVIDAHGGQRLWDRVKGARIQLRVGGYCSEHRMFNGLIFPTHRIVYPRTPSGHPFKLLSVMEGWLDDVEIVWK